MILIADSGSTKTEWCLADQGRPVRTVVTAGINPFFQTREEIAGEIQYACVIEAGMEQIFDILSDYDMELDRSAVEAFVKVMMSVKNNARLWANKGHTPNELAALYYRGVEANAGVCI